MRPSEQLKVVIAAGFGFAGAAGGVSDKQRLHTAHLLAGLVSVNGLVARVLAEAGATSDKVLAAIARGEGELAEVQGTVDDPDALAVIGELERAPSGLAMLSFSSAARHALAYAVEEARGLGHVEVEPEHVLLGLLADRDCSALVILDRLDVNLDVLHELKDGLRSGVLEPLPETVDEITIAQTGVVPARSCWDSPDSPSTSELGWR